MLRDVYKGKRPAVAAQWRIAGTFRTGILTGALILSTDRQVVLLHLTTAAERAEQAWGTFVCFAPCQL